MPASDETRPPALSVKLPPQQVRMDRRENGELRLVSKLTRAAEARSSGEWLDRWAKERPGGVFIAERSGEGWREVAYEEALERVRALAAGLLKRGMGPDTPIVMLSGAGVDHALLTLAAQYVGIPTAPLAEQYSLVPGAHRRLADILRRVGPAMAFTVDAGTYAEALRLPEFDGVEIVTARAEGAPRPVTMIDDLARGRGGVEVAHATVGPDTVAKYLFTSGSTSAPKGVITTQRMMCVNQAQIAAALPFLTARPPKILDWLPWNHVFGGSHNFNLVLANGGSLYVDNGRPMPDLFGRTLENMRAHAGTISFNVPLGYKLLLQELRRDAGLRRAFFADLDMLFYAGAALPSDVWDGLREVSLEERGVLPFMTSSWGMTETAPACLIVHEPVDRSGRIGVPLPDVEARLVPTDDKARYELRVKGPNIMPGYLKDEKKTTEAFDNEGFLITGDAVRFSDPADPDRGVIFDGRTSEDFKLMSGTWVQVSKLHGETLVNLAGLAQELVVCGHDKGEIGVLIFPARPLLTEQGINFAEDGDALVGDSLLGAIRGRLEAQAARATGSATRVARALVMAAPPSVEVQEITDKGSLNSRNIRENRAALLARLYDDEDPAVIRL
jgi:feruloyl-CoA synthase